jgi:hypothetical protein
MMISLGGTINPGEPVGGNSIQYEYRTPRVPRVQSSLPPLAISMKIEEIH